MKASYPLVTVVARSYNQRAFIREALDSVAAQDYPEIQLLIVDDASTDGSQREVESWLSQNDADHYLALNHRLGTCAAFNQIIPKIRGKYFIDFALDDCMLPQRISRQVAFFEKLPENYKVIFHEVQYCDAQGNLLSLHFADNPKRRFKGKVPDGFIFDHLLRKHFIPPPSTMFRSDILQELGGYDESLSYEDWEFLLRIGQKYHFGFQSESLTQVRRHKTSLSSQIGKRGDRQIADTLKVCQKVQSHYHLTSHQKKQLRRRIGYYIRKTARKRLFTEMNKFLLLYFHT